MLLWSVLLFGISSSAVWGASIWDEDKGRRNVFCPRGAKLLVRAIKRMVRISNQFEAGHRHWNRTPLPGGRKVSRGCHGPPTSAAHDQDPALHEDATLGMIELLTKYGYPGEAHNVTTQDGYILRLYRIPYGKKCGPDQPKKPPVLVMHGLLSNSIQYIINGVENGLGYILADACYDVWMGNSRGNCESLNHTNLTTEDGDFWKFSWHEMGQYDLPAFIQYIKEQTGKPKVHYIGHSEGNTQFFVYCSWYPEECEKNVIAMHALAPVAFMENMTSPLLKFLARHEKGLESLLDALGRYEFLPKTDFIANVGGNLCNEEHPNFEALCSNILFILFGYDSAQMNETLLQVISGHYPAGASSKQVFHFAQEVNSAKFRRYDHGAEQNLKIYGTAEPPDYEIEKIGLTLHLHYGENDWLAAVSDVERFANIVPNAILHKVPYPAFNHLDFLWAIDVKELLYNRVLEILDKDSQ